MAQMAGASVSSWGPSSGSEQGQRARIQSVASTIRGLGPGEGRVDVGSNMEVVRKSKLGALPFFL